MKKGRVLFGVILLLLISMSFVSLTSIVSAAESTTMVSIKSDDYLKTIVIRLRDPNAGDAIFNTKNVKTDAIGRGSFSFDTSRSEVQFLLLYVENSEVVKDVLTDIYDTGGAIELDFRENPDKILMINEEEDKENSTNEPIVENEVIENKTEDITEENKTGILSKTVSGFVIVKDKIINVNKIYYYLLGVVLIGGFVLVFMMKHKEPKRDPDVEVVKKESKSVEEVEQKIEELEKELQSTKQELGTIKEKGLREQRIREMKERLQRDQERLNNLEQDKEKIEGLD